MDFNCYSRRKPINIILGHKKLYEPVEDYLFQMCENIRIYKNLNKRQFYEQSGITSAIYKKARIDPNHLSDKSKLIIMDYIIGYYYRYFVGRYVDHRCFKTIAIFQDKESATKLMNKIGSDTHKPVFTFGGLNDIYGNPHVEEDDTHGCYDPQLEWRLKQLQRKEE